MGFHHAIRQIGHIISISSGIYCKKFIVGSHFFRHMFTRSFWQCAPHIVRHVPGFEVFDAHWCIYSGPTIGCAKKWWPQSFFVLTDSKLEPQFCQFFSLLTIRTSKTLHTSNLFDAKGSNSNCGSNTNQL